MKHATWRCGVAVLGLVIAAAGQARADLVVNGTIPGYSSADPPLIVGGGWQGFQFGAAGTFNTDGPFTYTSLSTTDLKVTDAFLKGDSFSVFDKNVLIFTTPPVPTSSSNTTSNPDVAFADPTYSHGDALLAAGVHSITIRVDNSPFGGGGAYLRADVATATPEPSTLVSGAIAGLMGIGYGWRRRKAKLAA